LALCGVLGVAGHTAVVVAAATGPALIVGALASMYPAATVSLARAVHRERLSRWQVVGLGSALAALALMVLGSA
jgi:drug/metabolite transporter (DMT)-like permease